MKIQRNIQDVFQLWESQTLFADGYYHQGQYKKASKVFSQSVDLIEPWLEKEDKELKTVIHLFVLSCHNTAHALYQSDRKKDAEYYYSHAHFRLLSLISQPRRSNKIMEIVMFELKNTLHQLTTFLTGLNKSQLAGNIKEESVRVLRQSYLNYVDDVFMA